MHILGEEKAKTDSFTELILQPQSEIMQFRRTPGEAPQTGNRNLLLFCRQGRTARLKPDPSDSQPDRERQNFLHFFYFFISHEQRYPASIPLTFIFKTPPLISLLQKSQELLPLHVALQIPILVLRLHDVIHNFYPVCFFRKVP